MGWPMITVRLSVPGCMVVDRGDSATLAQLVEHTLGKGEVVGSSPMGGYFGTDGQCV